MVKVKDVIGLFILGSHLFEHQVPFSLFGTAFEKGTLRICYLRLREKGDEQMEYYLILVVLFGEIKVYSEID